MSDLENLNLLNTQLEKTNKKLDEKMRELERRFKNTVKSLQDENTYLKTELEKHKTKVCIEVADGTDYKAECKNLKEQLNNAIKTIKYLSSLL